MNVRPRSRGFCFLSPYLCGQLKHLGYFPTYEGILLRCTLEECWRLSAYDSVHMPLNGPIGTPSISSGCYR